MRNKAYLAGLTALAFLAGGLAAPVSAGPAPEPRAGYLLTRTTSGPALLQLVVSGSPTPEHPRVFAGSFGARVTRQRGVERVVSLGARSFGHGEDDPAVSLDGTRHQACPPGISCVLFRTLAYTDGVYLEDDGGPTALNRFWVVTEGPLKVSLRGSGWRLAKAPLAYRYVLARDAAAAQVDTGRHSVEMSRPTQLPGGRRGSMAVLLPPCSTSSSVPLGLPVPRGVGEMALTGGSTRPSVRCPQDLGSVYPTAHSPVATTWRTEGHIVGDHTFQSVRLLVIDL